MGDVTEIRDEAEESFTGGEGAPELPEQGGSFTPTILPGTHLFRLPANIDQAWEAKDYEKKNADGTVIMAGDKPAVEQHLLLKFNEDAPLIVVSDDEYNGLPAHATITTIARPRGKKSDPNRPHVHDLTYFVRDSLNDKTPVTKKKEWIPLVNKYAGYLVRVEHGLSAQCSSDRVRYIDDGTGKAIEDPDGTKGCDHAAGEKSVDGSRLYTNDFKVKYWQSAASGNNYNTREEAIEQGEPADQLKQLTGFSDRAVCKNCGAMLRGFFRIERFLKPLASTQTVQQGTVG
jgi:hypothetical protein